MLHHLIAPLLALFATNPRLPIDTAPVLTHDGRAAVRTVYADGSVSVRVLSAACDDCQPYVASVVVYAWPGNTLQLDRVSNVGRPNNGANNEVVRRGSCGVIDDQCVYTGTTCRFDATWELTALTIAGVRANPCAITATVPGQGLITDVDGRIVLRWLVDKACGVAESTLVHVEASTATAFAKWDIGLTYGCEPCNGTFVID